MLNPAWRSCFRQLSAAFHGVQRTRPVRRVRRFRVRLEELESRLAPASFAVNAELEVGRLDNLGDTAGGTHAVVFFESSVMNYQVLRQGLGLGTDAVLLDSGGDGLREMAAFLASRHYLTSIGLVAHGAPGAVALGTGLLDEQSLSSYSRELGVVGSALGRGGELDLWSCDVGVGVGGESLVRDLAIATGAGVAAAEHTVGAVALGGDWQLDVRVAMAYGEVPFSGDALGAFNELLGTWGPAAPMISPRINHTTTMLANGKVLVTGGSSDPPFVLSSAEMYDSTTNIWSPAGSMSTPRENQTATLLANGEVLVAGGYNFNPLSPFASAELYDPASNTWTSAGSMITARYSQTATLLGNGKVLVAGGITDSVSGTPLSGASAELYDPVSNSWSSAGSMPTAGANQTATLLKNGKVLITGGWGSDGHPQSRVALYDPVSNTWSSVGSMATARVNDTATLLSNGKVLVAGGFNTNAPNYNPPNYLASAELFDPVSNTWTPAGSMITARYSQTATLLGNGKVLVAGGITNSVSGTIASAELYDPVSNSWSSAGSMPTAEANETATLLNNGKVLVMGGQLHSGTSSDNQTGSSNTELYDPGQSISPGSQFMFSVLGGNTVVAGSSFLFTAQAVDSSGNPVATYTGPSSALITTTPADLLGNLPITGALNSSGFGFFLGNLKTAGSYTLTTTAGAFTGTSSITVTPAGAMDFKVTAPATALTGSSFKVTVTAMDAYGNVATGYSGQVHFTSSAGHAGLPADAALTGGVGTFDVTLGSGGSETITATDTVSSVPIIAGTSSAIATRGLTVTSFTPTAAGFTATFSKPFMSADLTLYGTGLKTVQDVTLVGAKNGPIGGSLIIDPSNMGITFNATVNSLLLANDLVSAALPDDTYTVTLVSGSGSNGFLDALGAGLDGANNGGHGNYVSAPFTTHYQANATPVLGIPDFARGPDNGHAIKVPNDTGFGIPITLYNAASVTDVTFTLNYNPSLLNITAGFSGANSDATDPAGSFTMVAPPTIIDATHAQAGFHFSDSTPQSLTVVLGDIQATVPNIAAATYKAKELLQIGNIVVNGGAITGAVGANGVHVNAYLGDVSGNGTIDGLDVAMAFNVAQGKDTGFGAYQLLDPAIVGDVSLDYSVDAGAVSQLAAYTVHIPRAVIPAIPTGLIIIPLGE